LTEGDSPASVRAAGEDKKENIMNDGKENHLYWHAPSVTVDDRREKYEYKSCVLWFTGLSASGKSTLANALNKKLHDMGVKSYVLDGDNVRHGLNKDLGFSAEDRKENIRRIGEISKLFVDAGLITMTAFISPYKEDRANVRTLLKDGEFIEVYIRCPISECERRDPKGIYKKAKRGEIREFTGISAPYEEPIEPEIVIETDILTLDESLRALMNYLADNGYVKKQLID
jgi:adenylylsulfate kinase